MRMKTTNRRSKELSSVQERFCREYCIDGNGAQAAIRAGYKPASAKVQASVLLARPKIKARVAELQSEIAKKLNITTEFLTRELLTNHNLARETKKLNDSNRALELVAKMHGKLTEKIDLNEKIEININYKNE